MIYLRITPFGEDGPWADYQASDLVHLALGGMVMNCGYDPDTFGHYDTPPVAPQMWHAYHIAGELAAIQVMTALNYRLQANEGQRIDFSVHDASAKNTENDLPNWVYARKTHVRKTCHFSILHQICL